MKKKAIIWGTGEVGSSLELKECISKMYSICAYCDSSVIKERELYGFRVINPKELEALCIKKNINYIIIAIKKKQYVEEIIEYIKENVQCPVSIIKLEDILMQVQRTSVESKGNGWSINFFEFSNNWMQNFMSEVYWWKNAVKEGGIGYSWYLRCQENNIFNGLDKRVTQLAGQLSEGDVVMDIGCGPLTMYGNKLPNGDKICLLPIDPLASFYNVINQKCASTDIEEKRCLFGLFEFIACFYEENYADAIIINNALDHGIDPYKSIIECLAVLKIGKSMQLRHWRCEAIWACFDGLHKWNIDYDDNNNFIIWNENNIINVSEELAEYADVIVTHEEDKKNEGKEYIIAKITKKKDIDLRKFLDLDKEKRELGEIIKQLMEWASKEIFESY